MTETIAVTFTWKSAEVGKFKVGVFEPILPTVIIPLPVDKLAEYLVNLPDGNKALTIAGVHYCYLQLHDAMTLDPADLSMMYNDAPSERENVDDVGWGGDNGDTEKWDE